MDDALTKRADRLLADAKRAGLTLAVARRGNPTRDFKFNYGNRGRDAIRRQAVLDALDALIDAVTAVSAAA